MSKSDERRIINVEFIYLDSKGRLSTPPLDAHYGNPNKIISNINSADFRAMSLNEIIQQRIIFERFKKPEINNIKDKWFQNRFYAGNILKDTTEPNLDELVSQEIISEEFLIQYLPIVKTYQEVNDPKFGDVFDIHQNYLGLTLLGIPERRSDKLGYVVEVPQHFSIK